MIGIEGLIDRATSEPRWPPARPGDDDPEELQREILSYQQRLGEAYADRDRGIRDAEKRAEDCAEHGAEIRHLRHQAHSYWLAAEAADEIRKIYVGLNFHLEDALTKESDPGSEPVTAELRIKMARAVLANVKKAVLAARRRHASEVATSTSGHNEQGEWREVPDA